MRAKLAIVVDIKVADNRVFDARFVFFHLNFCTEIELHCTWCSVELSVLGMLYCDYPTFQT